MGLNLRCFMSASSAFPAQSFGPTCGPRLQQPLPHNAEAKMLLDRITLCAFLLIAAYCGVLAGLVQAVR